MPALTLYELQLSDNLTTTLVWSDARYGATQQLSNTAAQDSDFYFSLDRSDIQGTYIILENTSTTAAVTWDANNTITVVDGGANTGAFNGAGNLATLESGTNFGNATEAYAVGYFANFADIVTPDDTIEGNDTDRTGWL